MLYSVRTLYSVRAEHLPYTVQFDFTVYPKRIRRTEPTVQNVFSLTSHINGSDPTAFHLFLLESLKMVQI